MRRSPVTANEPTGLPVTVAEVRAQLQVEGHYVIAGVRIARRADVSPEVLLAG